MVDKKEIFTSFYKYPSIKTRLLLSEIRDILESMTHEEFITLASFRYGDPSLSIGQFLYRVSTSWRFVAIFSKVEGLVGLGEFYPPNKNALSEFSYFVFPKYQKKGFGRPLVERILREGLKFEECEGIFAETEVTNLASIKVLNYLNGMYPASKIVTNHKYTPPTKIYYWLSSK